MQRLAAVDHAEERRQFDWRIGTVGPFDESRDHSQREHGRNRGHEHRVRRCEDALGQQREAGRTIKEDDVVVATERVEQGRDDTCRLAEVTEQSIELAISEVRRQQVQVVVVGLLDGFGERLAALPGSSCRTLRRAAARGTRSWTRPEDRDPRAAFAGPAAAARYDRFTAVVVFPTPPFML